MNTALIIFLLFLAWIDRKLVRRITEMKEEVAQVKRQRDTY